MRFDPGIEGIRFRRSEPDAGVAHPVERHLAKVEVASSSLVTRSKKESPAKRLGFFSGDEARTIPSDSPADCRALPAGRQCNHRSARGTRRRRLVTRSQKSPAKRLGFLLLYSPARWGVCKTDDSRRLLNRGGRSCVLLCYVILWNKQTCKSESRGE